MLLAAILRTYFRALTPRRRKRRPAARRSRARAALLAGAASAVVAQIALSAAVETTRPHWRDPDVFYRVRTLAAVAAWNAGHAPDTPVVVILGSSRPCMGLSPADVRRGCGTDPPVVVNCARFGCQPVGQRLTLGRVLDAGVRPDFVLVEVFPPGFGNPRPFENPIPARTLGIRDLARLTPYRPDPAGIRAEWALARLAPWHAHRIELLNHAGLADWLPPGDRRDWRPHANPDAFGAFAPAVWTDADRAPHFEREKGYLAAAVGEGPVNPVVARAYRDTLAACRDHGVRAGLLLMPESPAFRRLYPAGTDERVRGLLAGLGGEFGVSVFDTSAWIGDEAAFADGHHLLAGPAAAFSERFGRECVRPWVRAIR